MSWPPNPNRALGTRSPSRSPSLRLPSLLLPPLLLLLAAAPSRAATVEVAAGFEAPVIGVEETVGFWIEVRSGLSRSGRFEPDFELDNLEILGRPSRSESFRFINGATARSLRLTWSLRPLAPGTAEVRSIRVTIGNRVLDLPTQRLQVVEEPTIHRSRPSGLPGRDPFRRFPPTAPARPRPPAQAPKVFLQAEMVPEQPFVGQQVLYTLYLYTQADISNIHTRQRPTFQGFWAHEVTLPKQLHPERIELHGEQYARMPLLKWVLFARRPGRIEVEPAEFDLVVQVRSSSRLTGSFSVPQMVTRRSNPLRLEVRELPPGPEAFSGAVGDFALSAELEPPELQVGEAATLTVTLAGDGHIQSLPAPEPPQIPGVTIYPPEEISQEEVDPARLVGRRSWKYVLVPRQTGSWKLDSFRVPFYDPAVDAYRVAASAPLTLRALPVLARAEEADLPVELNPIRSAAVPLGDGSIWQALLPWLFLLPFGSAAALTLARRFDLLRGGHRQATTAEMRERLEALVKLELGEGQAGNRQLASRVEQAWSDYLEQRWDLPPGVPAARWEDVLNAHPTAGPGAAELLSRLATDIHYLRYAPQLSTTQPLRDELLEHSRHVLRQLP